MPSSAAILRMNKIRVVVPAVFAIASAFAAHAAAAPPEILLKKLADLAGAGAEDCGVLPLYAKRASAIACARTATASGKPYRLVVELSGRDAYTWQGAARDERGNQWAVFYDADAASGAEASPGLGQLRCRDIKFDPGKEEVIDCTPSTGEP